MANEPCVQLTLSEILIGSFVGVMRHVQDMKRKYEDAHGGDGNLKDWQVDCEGALGEMALAKHLGFYWSGNIGNVKAPDVGPYEVRTAGEHWHHLLLHPTDKDDRPYVLVTGKDGRYRLQGWILGRDGKQQRWWKEKVNGRPCFFVPQSALQPIDTLKHYEEWP